MVNIKYVTLKENWYKFFRFHCKEGHIDLWSGDMANNPNNEFKSNINLNTSTYYFRLNNGDWVNKNEFKSHFHLDFKEFCPYFTAEEIYNQFKLK